jgi:hypothetical protein
MNEAAPARVSLLFNPAALLLALGFVMAFYWAAVPLSTLREDGSSLPGLILAMCGAGVPVAGFVRNRHFFADPRRPGRARAAMRLVAESAALLFVLLVFANATAGGEEEGRLLGRVSALTIEASGIRRQVDLHVARHGSLEKSGTEPDLAGLAHRGESFIGRDGAIVLYDSDLRAVAAMIPELRRDVVDWQYFGMPARAFPEHWRGQPESSFTREESGDATDHSQALLRIATGLQHRISARAKELGTLAGAASAGRIPNAGVLDFGFVDRDGRFALYSDRYGVFLYYEPTIRADGLVDWRCRSYPREAAVPGCATQLD